jgi:hypothetical protein
MVNGHFYSMFGHYSFRVSNMLHRIQASAVAQQAQSDLASLTDAMSGGTAQLSQGLSQIAAQRAVARIKATTNAHIAAAAALNAPATQSPRGDSLYYEVDRMINSVPPAPPAVDVTS